MTLITTDKTKGKGRYGLSPCYYLAREAPILQCVLGKAGLGFFGQGSKRELVKNGKIRQHFAVNGN